MWTVTDLGPTNPSLNLGVVGNGDCTLPPKEIVTAVDGSNHVSRLKVWQGGTCQIRPTNYAVYAATCDPARGKGCLGSPTGLTAKESQYTGVSSAYAVAVGTGVNTYTTVTANINKHNAADPKGLVSSAFAYIVVDGSGQMRCGSNDYGTGINPDFNIVTGAQIPIGYSPASDRWPADMDHARLPGVPARRGC